MPIQARLIDNFTTENILLGFSNVVFAPKLASGAFGVDVNLGILQSQTFERERETLKLPDGSSGLTTTARELVSRLEPAMNVQLFNFKSNVAQLVFGSETITSVVADAAAVITDDPVALPATPLTYNSYIGLTKADISEASVAVTCAQIVAEVPAGVVDGANVDFQLDFKTKVFGDVTSILFDGVEQLASGGGTLTLINTGTPAALEVDVIEGEIATSGELEFGTAPPNGIVVTITYTPSFSGADFTLDTDFAVDPTAGRIRFLETGAAVGPLRDEANAGEQPLLVSYTYVQLAGVNLKPYTKPSLDGRATIFHLPSIGSNFIWTIPKVSLIVNADAITFGSDDFITGSLSFTIIDAGGTDRFGTILLSSESEAGNI